MQLTGIYSLLAASASAFEMDVMVERSMPLYSNTNYCRLPKSPSGKEIWSCSDHQNEASTCEVLCPAGFKLSDSANKLMTCSCAAPEGQDTIHYPDDCHWSGHSVISQCVFDSDNAGGLTEEEYVTQNSIDNSCVALAPPENGSIDCTNAFYEGSMCRYSCTNDPLEMIFPAAASQRKCICREAENGKNGCYWSKNSQPLGNCFATPEYFIEEVNLGCEAVPADLPNAYTTLTCSDTNAFDSNCEYTCAADFRIDSIGRGSTCDCYRKKGVYECNWSRNLDKHCVPAPRWYRKFNREYRQVQREGDAVKLAEMDALYDDVDTWANDRSVAIQKERKRRAIRMQRTINEQN